MSPVRYHISYDSLAASWLLEYLQEIRSHLLPCHSCTMFEDWRNDANNAKRNPRVGHGPLFRPAPPCRGCSSDENPARRGKFDRWPSLWSLCCLVTGVVVSDKSSQLGPSQLLSLPCHRALHSCPWFDFHSHSLSFDSSNNL